MTDWVTTTSELATGLGTLVLAIATFASVRSANLAARTAQDSMRAGMRPVLMHSRLQDPQQKVAFGDDQWVAVLGGSAAVVCTENVIYLAVSVRNAGTGMGILHGWRLTLRTPSQPQERPPLEEFTAQTRDMYVAPTDVAFWQGALRDPDTEAFQRITAAIRAGDSLALDLLYGDFEGGQRVISRFSLAHSPFGGPGPDAPDGPAAAHPAGARAMPGAGGESRWLASVVRHWNVDRPDPR